MVLQDLARPHRWHIEFLNSQPLNFENMELFYNNGINTLWIVWTSTNSKYSMLCRRIKNRNLAKNQILTNSLG